MNFFPKLSRLPARLTGISCTERQDMCTFHAETVDNVAIPFHPRSMTIVCHPIAGVG